MKCGYTTGTCAALAAKASALALLNGKFPAECTIITPAGIEVTVPIEDAVLDETGASCAVRKDAGDDPDITDGMLICAKVQKSDTTGIRIDGGIGIGRVTKPGLDQASGEAAINHVPRRMIREAVLSAADAADYEGGLLITISAPLGEKTAEKTFNPKLGITGGISILGTSGIVKPMSDQAIIDTIALEIRQASLSHDQLIITPGNYGMRFLGDVWMPDPDIPVIQCSNFIGDTIDLLCESTISHVIFAGHIGKFIKLAGGIMNTHSKYADCRMELFCAHAALCGAEPVLIRNLYVSATTDACIGHLKENQLFDAVMDSLLAAIRHHLDRRIGGSFRYGFVTFSNVYGVLGSFGTLF